MENKIIRINELADTLGISKVTLWRWRKEGILPKPIQIGSRVVAWREDTINEWLNERSRDTNLPY